MISKKRFLLLAINSVLLLTCLAISAVAQTPQPTPNINDPVMRFPGDKVRSPTESRVKILTTSVLGKIRWKKEYGLPSIDGGMTPDKATNCTAIRVMATVQEGAPGTFGKAVNVGYIALQNEPTEENGYYTCGYSITDRNNDLPRNRVITVSAFLGPYASPDLNRALVMGPWYGGSQSQPPLGYQRVVAGSRGVTLTDGAPHTTVDFEVVYQPVPQGPR
jgi:hypothetical protein